jgi:DNA processing protein
MAVDNQDAAAPRKARMSSFPVFHVDRGASFYPDRLERRLSKPPARLFYRGSLPEPGPRVGIVGARSATTEGCQEAAAIARRLGGDGFAVVSGGALGIDGAAHEGALAAGVPTFAVLGCGADVVYPERHGPLFDRIAARGGLLSEYPPGTRPCAGHFPARNRLIAALVDLVIVVEAGLRSGALITARIGAQMGLPVLAVGGSPGTDELIGSRRARVLRPSTDILLQIRAALAGGPMEPPPEPRVDGPFAQLAAALVPGPSSAQEVAVRLDLPIGRVMSLLSEAELTGRVQRLPGGRYEVSRVH